MHHCSVRDQTLLPLLGGVLSTNIPGDVADEQIWAPLQEMRVT